MPEEFKAGCSRPARKSPMTAPQPESSAEGSKEEIRQMIKVGKPAPDFTATAYIKGKFANVTLSEYKGKWVVLCFYPGDFTFV